MGQVFRSGAFLQQCWSVHPLCVSVRRITDDNQLALACTACRFAHYVTMGSVVFGPSASEESGASTDASEARRDAQDVGHRGVQRDQPIRRPCRCARWMCSKTSRSSVVPNVAGTMR